MLQSLLVEQSSPAETERAKNKSPTDSSKHGLSHLRPSDIEFPKSTIVGAVDRMSYASLTKKYLLGMAEEQVVSLVFHLLCLSPT